MSSEVLEQRRLLGLSALMLPPARAVGPNEEPSTLAAADLIMSSSYTSTWTYFFSCLASLMLSALSVYLCVHRHGL